MTGSPSLVLPRGPRIRDGISQRPRIEANTTRKKEKEDEEEEEENVEEKGGGEGGE